MSPVLKRLPLESIRVSKIALRDVNTEDVAFKNFVDNIRTEGVINAINVREVPASERDGNGATVDGKDYILIDGLQRYTASSIAGFTDIPAQILDRDEASALVTQIIGNAQRIETKPAEFARALLRVLATDITMTEATLAQKLNMSPNWIQKVLGLNHLADSLKALVDEGVINVTNAFSLAKLPPEEQLNWSDRAQTMGAAEFTPKVMERIKEIKDNARKGLNPGTETFTPTMHLRTKSEIEAALDNRAVALQLITETQILNEIKDKKDAAAAGFKLGLEWALNYDPKSKEAQQKKDDERKAVKKAEAEKRNAEKKRKADADAQIVAADARARAAALDPDILIPKATKKIVTKEVEPAEQELQPA